MNQEKIGKFIRELRNEKKMTQGELAKRIGVSDKAISKWENGRCLMDLSLLKPLSSALDISIVELINGERISDDNLYDKSNEVVNDTLKYSKDEIKRNKIRVISITLISIICIIFGFYLIRQSYYWLIYPNDVSSNCKSDCINFRNTLKIYKKTLDDSEYVTYGNLKMKNIFSNYIISEESSDFSEVKALHSLRLIDGEGNSKFYFVRQLDDIMINSYFMNDEFGNDILLDESVMRQFYLDNNIDDELELMKYFDKYGVRKSNLFTTPENMKFNLMYNMLTSTYYSIDFEYVDIIEGDYNGYLRKVKNSEFIEVLLFKDNVTYKFMFVDELANYDMIVDLISTVEIR